MNPFWRFAKEMLRYPATMVGAISAAILAATGLGIGIASLEPIMGMMLGDDEKVGLLRIAESYNAGSPAIPVPQWLIALLPAEPYHSVMLILGVLCVLTALGAAANFIHQYLSVTVATKAIVHIRQQAFRHVMLLPLTRVTSRGPSEFVARIIRDTSALQSGFVVLMSKSVAQITRGLAAFVVAIFASWQVAVIAPLAAVLLGVILRKLGKRIRRAQWGSLGAQERLLRISTESIQGLRAVKANTAERRARWRFHKENKEFLRQELKARTARALSTPLVETITMLLIAAMALYFARRIIVVQDLTFERFAVSLIALIAAGASIKPLANIVNELQAAAAPAERLTELFSQELERLGDQRRTLPRHARSIEFERVTMTYPGTDRPALHNVSLRLEHGQRIAIVGPNGSGKTTLISLVPRLLRPELGRVVIDDVDIESVSLRSLRRQIAVVTQETMLFRGSIAENIAFGIDCAPRSAIESAAHRAHAHEFIMALPGGYEAHVAEQGATLSGGQRQRLAIARAILRDPSILILDEATSQIDGESEDHIAQAMTDFARGRTSLIVAHRLGTVLNADQIVVMDEGRIVDTGRHNDLLDRCDLYQRLARTQLIAPADRPATT